MMYRARQVGPEHPLYRVVERLAQRGGAADAEGVRHPRHVAQRVCDGPQPQHAAVAATEGILRVLDERELEGVIAHELSHVKHRDILISSVAATIAAAIMMLARMAQFAALFGGGRGSDDREGATRSRCWPRSSWRLSPRC